MNVFFDGVEALRARYAYLSRSKDTAFCQREIIYGIDDIPMPWNFVLRKKSGVADAASAKSIEGWCKS